MRGFWLELFAICVVVQTAAANDCTVCDTGVVCLPKEEIKDICPQGRPCTEEESKSCKELITSARSRLPQLFSNTNSGADQNENTVGEPPAEMMTRGGAEVEEIKNGDEMLNSLEDLLELMGVSGKDVCDYIIDKLKVKKPIVKMVCTIIKTFS